ncbi:MAG TPA: zf-HC2 domain-containing protein [Burkholderiaceae bacterium]|jgi:anti-sigma factor RsiW|nr:zf-HC2 domain-containing protein [Burkholderiaceae bacterium]
MTCPRHEEASVYIDDMMTPAERARFEAHLPACPLCRQQVDDLFALQRQLRALPSPALGFDLAARLEDRIRETQAARRRPARMPSWLNWGVTGAAVAASLVTGVWLGGLLIGGGTAAAPSVVMVRVFDPVPPGGLCAAAELCRASEKM